MTIVPDDSRDHIFAAVIFAVANFTAAAAREESSRREMRMAQGSVIVVSPITDFARE